VQKYNTFHFTLIALKKTTNELHFLLLARLANGRINESSQQSATVLYEVHVVDVGGVTGSPGMRILLRSPVSALDPNVNAYFIIGYTPSNTYST